MLTIFEKILLGHLIGDYLIQSKKMALTKSIKGLNGLKWCSTHCLLYTLAVCLLTATSDPIKISLIFMSHFPIDRWSLANKWLKMIRGRNLKLASEIDLSFSVIIYVVVDNTIHILLMTAIFKYF
jgi:hypothetical protein